jgi:hypothetical protein
MSFEVGIVAVIAAVMVYIFAFKNRSKPVDMNHKAPNVHNVQMKGRVGPAPVPVAKAAPAKKTTKKKKAKATTTKKKAVKK